MNAGPTYYIVAEIPLGEVFNLSSLSFLMFK